MNKRMIAVIMTTLALQSLSVPVVFADDSHLAQESSTQQLDDVNEITPITTSPMIEVDFESNFTYEIVNGEAQHVKFIGEIPEDGKVVFPNEIKGYPVTSIGSFALLEMTDRSAYQTEFCTRTDLVKEVVLPDTVKEIENQAFFYCNKLQAINAPEALEKIGEEAFVFNYDLKSLDFSNTHLKSMGDFSLCAAVSLETLILPDCFEQFWEHALTRTDELGDLNLCNTNIKSLPDGLLQQSGIESICLPETLERIDTRAFGNCPSLTEVNIEYLPNLNYIGNYAFEYDRNLELTTLPESLRSLGSSTFRYCDNIKDLVVPVSFTRAGDAYCFPEQATLHVKSGSYGLDYAQKNSMKYTIED